MKRRIFIKIKNLLVVVILAFILYKGAYFLWNVFRVTSAGSYPNVETWSFDVPETELIQIIHKIKKEHPELVPPNVTYPIEEQNGYWYEITFYYYDTNENVYTWTRSNEDGLSTTFAFVAIAPHIDKNTLPKDINTERKKINSDFGYWENRGEIKKFENKIVKLIEDEIK